MKIIMTIAEIATLVRNQYNLPDSAVLEITDAASAKEEYAALIALLKHNGCLSASGDILPEKKIPAIKTLREVVSSTGKTCGLAQAKFAVEDWKNFSFYVTKNGFPQMDCDSPTYGWRD